MRKKRTPLETERPVNRVRPFPPRRQYASLSIEDLLDAREAYHAYLSTLDNVAATAVGRYLIRQDDWDASNGLHVRRPKSEKKATGPRTLGNSVVRPWSWPAVLVFVKKWEAPAALGNNIVPPTLYLSDGRVIPTCVIEAQPVEQKGLPASPAFSSPLLGGGYSCLREHQGQQSLGTFACLVRKGGTYYALTNRHVAGGEGEIVRARIRGDYVEVGKTSSFAVDRIPMAELFPGWAGPRVYLTGDAGLVRIDDINDWTSQAFGIGEIGDVYDATKQTVTLDLIDCPVRAFGGTSGVAEGQIRALFFRYQSLGGFEYATDLLIGPRIDEDIDGDKQPVERANPFTRPGDSGTLWFYDPPSGKQTHDIEDEFDESAAYVVDRGERARRLRPIAMQWGGTRIKSSDGEETAYALVTFLSSISRMLDVEIVRDWSIGHDEYWGKIGHFAIGWKACDRFRIADKIGLLFSANQKRIGFGNERLEEGSAFRMGRDEFVPLSDVPDYVWVNRRPSEPMQHFADIDIRDIDGGTPMLERCLDRPDQNISAKRWHEYFDGFAHKEVGPEEGTLPFRVWQLWDAMVAYLRDGDVLRYVAAAGVLAHYIGDASQPLHCSYLHHGVPPTKKTIGGRKYPIRRADEAAYAAWKKTDRYEIHATYEQLMFEADPAEALGDVDDLLKKKYKAPDITSGYDAAYATILMMADAMERLPPRTIIDADDPALTPKPRARRLWQNKKVREETIVSLANSVRLLAALWESAWEVGKGNQIAQKKLITLGESRLTELVRNEKKFVPSLSLKRMADSGEYEP